jgi:hypothetical protein
MHHLNNVGARMQPSPVATISLQSRYRRVPAVLIVGCVLMSAYWIAVMGIHGFKSLNPHEQATPMHSSRMDLKTFSATWGDPVFNALPMEMKWYVQSRIDPEFAQLSPTAQYQVIDYGLQKYGPKKEFAAAMEAAVNSTNWIALPMEPADRIALGAAHSIPYGIALTAFVVVVAVGRWLFSTIPFSVARPTVVAAGLVLVLGMTLYPPWALQIRSEAGHVLSTTYKYGWLFTPPTPDGDTSTIATVDWSRLLLEWVVAGIAIAGVVYLIQSPRAVGTATDHTE